MNEDTLKVTNLLLAKIIADRKGVRADQVLCMAREEV